MKTFAIYFFDTNLQVVDYSCESAFVKAKNSIEALRTHYLLINTLAGAFKTFTYSAKQIFP